MSPLAANHVTSFASNPSFLATRGASGIMFKLVLEVSNQELRKRRL